MNIDDQLKLARVVYPDVWVDYVPSLPEGEPEPIVVFDKDKMLPFNPTDPAFLQALCRRLKINQKYYDLGSDKYWHIEHGSQATYNYRRATTDAEIDQAILAVALEILEDE